MPVTVLLALHLVLTAAPAGAARTAPPVTVLGPPERGHLVTADRQWHGRAEGGVQRLCLTIENRDARTAHEVMVWVEMLGGSGTRMRRLAVNRTPATPATLGPGERGIACIDTPASARGIFIRLRARWAPPPKR